MPDATETVVAEDDDMSMAESITPFEQHIRRDLRLARRLPALAPAQSDHPPEPVEARQAYIAFSSASAHEEPTDFRKREECHDVYARLTVYAICVCIMIFAFPVGFAVLIFNILGGENLRTTAHAMALTGLGVALALPGFGLAASFL